MFGSPAKPLRGIDLAARNIQRGRDHGLPYYTQAQAYFGLPPATDFTQISKNSEIVEALRQLYDNDINKVETYVGALAEDPVDQVTPLGPLLRAAIEEQYTRLRDGDRYVYFLTESRNRLLRVVCHVQNRFYFENEDAGFTEEERNEIRRTRLADIILRNTDITSIQCSVFFSSKDLSCRKDPGSSPPSAVGPTNSVRTFSNIRKKSSLIHEGMNRSH